MDAKEFVKMFHIEKQELLKQYFNVENNTDVYSKINALNLTNEQTLQIRTIIDTVLSDVMYTILLGLDGEASIGNIQQTYKLYDEKGNLISDCGEIEQYAYEIFHE